MKWATVLLEHSSLIVRRLLGGEPIHVLLSWSCETCSSASFAEVVMTGGCVTSIDTIVLDPTSLGRIHFIEEGLEDMIYAIIGDDPQSESGLGADWLAKLTRSLELGKRWGSDSDDTGAARG